MHALKKAGLVLIATLSITGCAVDAQSPASSAKVTGSVTYRERIALPSSAVVKVRLVEVSRADAPAIVIGEQLIKAAGRQVPFAFDIAYDPKRIDERFSYAVQARIEDEDGRLRFVSDRNYRVLTRGAGNHLDLVLSTVGAPAPK